jgi:DNA-binding MarR family transcriptional regulator
LSDVLRDFVPFLLYRIVAKSVRMAGAEYADLDLGIQDARVLIVLLHNPGIRVGTLADLTCIEQSALSHQLRRLSKAKLLTRERVEDDNRSVAIRLSAKGHRIAQRCYELAQMHDEILLGDIPEDEVELLRRTLRQMYDNANEWADRDPSLPAKQSGRDETKLKRALR